MTPKELNVNLAKRKRYEILDTIKFFLMAVPLEIKNRSYARQENRTRIVTLSCTISYGIPQKIFNP